MAIANHRKIIRRRSPALLAAGLFAGAFACTPGAGSEQAPPGLAPQAPAPEADAPTTKPEDTVSLEGIVRVPHTKEEHHRGKTFLGALLWQEGGAEWVITYRSESPFHELRDRLVLVEGTPYEPKYQAIRGRHLRVSSMKLVSPKTDASLVEALGEERLTGRFEEYTFPEGTKLAGEKWIRFVDSGGTAFFLSHVEGTPLLGKTVTVVAYRVKPSPVVARPEGPYLWILYVEARGP